MNADQVSTGLLKFAPSRRWSALMLGGLIACLVSVAQTAAPIILKQPVDVTAAHGDSVTLRVEAIGPGLEYRWEKQTGKSWVHRVVVGGNRETLPLEDLKPADAGTYRVIVSSQGYGSAISREFTISFPADVGTDRVRVVAESGRVKAGLPVGPGVVLAGKFFYPGYDPETGVELWSTDGTAFGTKRVKDINPGAENGIVVLKGPTASLAAYNGRVYFTASDDGYNRALWSSDGTAAGTQLIQGNFEFPPITDPLAGFEDLFSQIGGSDLELAGFTEVNDILYFVGKSGIQTALFRTDGTAAGTFSALPEHSVPPIFTAKYFFTEVEAITQGPNGKVFFLGETADEGRELWISDGTDNGTYPVKDIRPGTPDGIIVKSLTASAGKVYFMAQDATSGLEPWVSDGTSAGTFRLRDINPGSASSLAYEFTPVGGQIYFSAQSAGSQGLWKTDGTTAGTVLVKEFEGGPSRLRASNSLLGADRLYFTAQESSTGFELWQSDGTAAGTARVLEVVPGVESSWPLMLGTDQGSLYFLNERPETARSLWFSNGSEAGTVRLTESAALLKHALLRESGIVSPEAFFASYKTEGGREIRIYKTTGTIASTVELATIPYAELPEFQWADLGERKLLNTAGVVPTDFRTGDLIVTDGTVAGTTLLNLPTLPGTFGGMVEFKDGLVFTKMVDEGTAGLYRVDGLKTSLLRTFPADSARSFAVASLNRALFVMDSESATANAFHTDGTVQGTKELQLTGAYSLNRHGIGVLGDAFLLAYSPSKNVETGVLNDIELYRINADGTKVLVKDMGPDSPGSSTSSRPAYFTKMGDHIYFFTSYPPALWRTDGTAAGTTKIREMEYTDFYTSRPGILGDRLYFGGQFAGTMSNPFYTGTELWKSSGSTTGTIQFREIYPGTVVVEDGFLGYPMLYQNGSYPAEFTTVGNTLFFAATGPAGRELWKSDGTVGGTQMVKNLSTGDEEASGGGLEGFLGSLGIDIPDFPAFTPAANKTNPTNFVAVAGRLYFVARDDEGTKLFRSDGTASGTVAIESVRTQMGRPRELTSLNNRLYYIRGQVPLKDQLWEYNPQNDSHRVITSLAGGVAKPGQLAVSDGRLYFLGDDGEGQKLFAYERVPFIKEHPASQTILAGGTATLNVVTSVPDLNYSWQRGVVIQTTLGTNSTLAVAPGSVSSQPYSVRVTKSGVGAQRSHSAQLRILDAITSSNIVAFPDSWWTKTVPDSDPGTPATPGTLDQAWGTSNMVSGAIGKIINLPDGKILIAGSFGQVAGTNIKNLARLNHDGTLDTTFDPGTGPLGTVQDMAVLEDGKIMIVGNFLTVNGYQRERVARLHADGAVDLEFKTPINPSGGPSVYTVLAAGGDKVFIGGLFEAWDGHPTVSVARLNADGTVDTTFILGTQPNTGGPFRVAAMAFYPSADDPQWLLVGGGNYFVEAGNGFTNQRRHVARLNPVTGAWDPTFNIAPIPNPPASIDGSVTQIVPQPDGKILLSGVQGGGHTVFDGMVRLNANGSLDTTFHTGPTTSGFGPTIAAGPFRAIQLLPGGQIVAGGRFSTVQNSPRTNIVQLQPTGMRDPAFAPGEGPNNEVVTIATQADGGILIAGQFTKVNGIPRAGFARLHGIPSPPLLTLPESLPQLDLSNFDPLKAVLKINVLGSPAPSVTWYRGETMVGTGPVLPVDKTDPANAGEYYAVIENASGITTSSPFTLSFDSGPPVIQQPPHDTLASLLGSAVFTVEATGALPLAYQWKRNGAPISGETNRVLRVKIQGLDAGNDDYTVTVSNRLALAESQPVRAIVSRLGARNTCFYEYTLPAGLDDQFTLCYPPNSFDFPDYSSAETVAFQPNGHVIIGGGQFSKGSKWSPGTPPFLMRFTEWGVRAWSGEERPDGVVHKVTTASDSSVYIAGDFKNIVDQNGAVIQPKPGIAKYDANMKFVPGFSPTLLPANARVTALLVQPDGKLLIAGTFSNVNGVANLGVARLLPTGQSDLSFSSGIVFMQYGNPLALAVQANGKILVGGQGAYYGEGTAPYGEFRNQLCRLNADGSWDATFETAGGAANAGFVENVSRILIQPDQRIVISGSIARWGGVTRNSMARLLPDGALDTSFDPGAGPGGLGGIQALALLPNGQIYVVGTFSSFDGIASPAVARINPDGLVDEGYRGPNINHARDIALLPDQSAFIAGSFRSGPFTPPISNPRVTEVDWTHPSTGSTHKLSSYEFDPMCVDHSALARNMFGGMCGNPHACLNGIMRLHGEDAEPEPPSIQLQPQGVLALADNSAHTLFVGVSGAQLEGAKMNYQWRKNGIDIPNAILPYFPLNPLTKDKEGTYSVRVWNDLGEVVSADAVVKVNATSTPRGEVMFSLAAKKFEWRFNSAAGKPFTAADAQALALEVSEDLKTWITVPGAVSVDANGRLVLSDEQAALKAKRFYRIVSGAKPKPPSAAADPTTLIPLADVPESIRTRAQKHIAAFIGKPTERGPDELQWENVTFAEQARQVFDPTYLDGNDPAFVELKLVNASNSSDERGYILLSLTTNHPPIVEFSTEGSTKTERVLREKPSGIVTKFMRINRGYVVGEDAGGQPLATLGTMPLKVLEYPQDYRTPRVSLLDTDLNSQLSSPPLSANYVPYQSYEELKQDLRTNPLLAETRRRRAAEATGRWKLRSGEQNPRLLLPASESKVFHSDQVFARVQVVADEDEPAIQVERLRNGGFQVTALRAGSEMVRAETLEGKVEYYTVTSSSGAVAPLRAFGGCETTDTDTWLVPGGFNRWYHQLTDYNHPNWCPSVGCGPTALAMLFGWWDAYGVPSAFYSLKSGRGQTDSFRFDQASLVTQDAPEDLEESADVQTIIPVYEDLHELCNTFCNPFGSAGATWPDQMKSAFLEYVARIALPWPSPMDEFGQEFVSLTYECGYGWPSEITDWEGGGKAVAKGIKEGRPGVVGFDYHYALAYGYKRIDYIEGCGNNADVVDTERYFRCNMGWGGDKEWHDATDVWFGLTAHFWQNFLPSQIIVDIPSIQIQALLGTATTEVRRPAAAMTPNAEKLFLVEGENHGNTPTQFTRMTSANGGASFTTPLTPSIGSGLFISGPAIVTAANGQELDAFGLGTDKRLWRASSSNGGQTWPNAWGQFGPDRLFKSAPAAAASGGATTIHIVAMGTDKSFYTFASRNGGQTWPLTAIPLGGTFKSAPAVVTSFDGKIVHVFGQGADNRIWRGYSFNAGTNWWGWVPIGEGVFNSAPAAVMRFDGGVIHVFARGMDYQFWRAVSGDGGANWSSWYQVPSGIFTSGPAATLQSDGTIRLYGRGTIPDVPQGSPPDPAEPRIWQAISPDGGNTWPGGFGKIVQGPE